MERDCDLCGRLGDVEPAVYRASSVGGRAVFVCAAHAEQIQPRTLVPVNGRQSVTDSAETLERSQGDS